MWLWKRLIQAVPKLDLSGKTRLGQLVIQASCQANQILDNNGIEGMSRDKAIISTYAKFQKSVEVHNE